MKEAAPCQKSEHQNKPTPQPIYLPIKCTQKSAI